MHLLFNKIVDTPSRFKRVALTNISCTRSPANGSNYTTKHAEQGEWSELEVSDDAYARRLVRTTREAYAQRLSDAGKPLPAIIREALEKQCEEQKRELRREKRVEQDLSKALVKHTTS
ncbi:hypothetical protein PI124_g16022 [Phytophthora idaei]|nr:hypothetical protein PI124_g16022 [Phytophthora idaei]